MFSIFTEPNAPPTNVQGHNTSSTSILVQWGNVPTADQNGIILSYTVTYRGVPNGSPLTKIVSAPTIQVTLRGLNEYTNYSFTVFASTVKGDGNVSAPIIVITDEDSKSLVLFCLIYSWIYENNTGLGLFLVLQRFEFRGRVSQNSLRMACLASKNYMSLVRNVKANQPANFFSISKLFTSFLFLHSVVS